MKEVSDSGLVSIQSHTTTHPALAYMNTEQQADTVLLREAVNGFLDSLERERRIVFIQRYWYMLGISEIAAERGMTEGAVKMSLKRTRDSLKIFLEKEGFTV